MSRSNRPTIKSSDERNAKGVSDMKALNDFNWKNVSDTTLPFKALALIFVLLTLGANCNADTKSAEAKSEATEQPPQSQAKTQGHSVYDQTRLKLQEVLGQYEGEVRLQSSDGKVDRLLVSNIQLTIGVAKNELVVSTNRDLLSSHCHSKIGSIQELLLLPMGESEVLRAAFGFTPNRCKEKSTLTALVLFANRDLGSGPTVETLITPEPVDLSTNPQLGQKLNVHGFFTRKGTGPQGTKS
jgi:hypothetical protein